MLIVRQTRCSAQNLARSEFFLRGCAPQSLIAGRVFQRDLGDLDHSRTGHGVDPKRPMRFLFAGR